MTTVTVSNAPASNNPDYPISTNSGTTDNGTQRVTIATDCTVTTSLSGLVSASSGTADAGGTEVGVYVRPVTPSADVARIGSLTETAPLSDTASSGLNGRLQRIAQRLTSILTALSDKTQFTKLTDGTNNGTFEASQTYNTGITAATASLDVNAKNAQLWASSHPDNSGAAADDKYYAQNQDPNGNLSTNISSIRGKLLRFNNQIGTTIAGTNPPPLPIGGYGVSSAPTSVTSGRAVDAYWDQNGRLCVFSDQTFAVAGSVASGSSDSGNPIKVGGVGKTANPTAVTDGQRVNALFDKLGKQVVVGAIRDLKGVQNTTITSSVSETTIVTAVASTFLDLYSLILTNTSATGTEVTIKDATAGTTRFSFYVPANDTRGFTVPVDSAVPQAAVNNNWTATCGTSVASLKVTALYVKNI